MNYIIKIGFSFLTIIVYFCVNAFLRPTATLLAGQIAGKQFASSDTSYVASTVGLSALHDLTVPLWVVLVVLLLIWFLPFRRSTTLSVVALLGLGLGHHSAEAYYQKSDYTEAFSIMPSESAFWIPDVGDNKNSQTRFDSAEYLKENKIALKRFLIPHTKLQGSGAFFDYFVPAGRLIIVDRSPYAREWMKSAKKGTSKEDESFVCQSREGLDITVGLAIGVTVSEDNSPLFLSNFGIDPIKGDRGDPNVVFASVYYGRSLAEVMDYRLRPKVEALVCKELMSRNLDEDNDQAGQIIDIVEKNVNSYLSARGITLDYIGWADTFTFSPIVQAALNERYATGKIQPVIDVLKQKTVLDAVSKNGWDGKLPTTISMSWWPESLTNWLLGLFSKH